MTPTEIIVIIFPLATINLTLLLFFATRSKDKLDKIDELKKEYVAYLADKLSDIVASIDMGKFSDSETMEQINNLLDIHYDMSDFRCDYDYKCMGILKNLAINFIFIFLGCLFFIMTNIEPELIALYSAGAGALLIISIYYIGYGIFKAIKEGATLREFDSIIYQNL